MKVVIFSKARHRTRNIQLSGLASFALLTLALALVGGSTFYAGYMFAALNEDPVAVKAPAQVEVADVVDKELERLRGRVDATRIEVKATLEALSQRVGRLQAEVTRINAFGQRMTHMAKLDGGEFDFSRPPAQGGPGVPLDAQAINATELLKSLDDLERELKDRERQLLVLEDLMLDRQLQEAVQPAGRPLTDGWISSGYGRRTDPITGRKQWHHGYDFAGKEGSEVMAVAAGVVIWSGKRSNYGYMVEIDHGDGYTTRYAHNKKNLVKPGDMVKRGDVIALLGNTGRSTGPHVHFEVRKDGRPVNPRKFILAAR
jgi:murein DD-endopeptidase MepM/ murein hydrolase activator NlpD